MFLKKLKPGTHKIWAKEYLQGKTLQQIADRYGVSKQAVHNNLQKQNIKMRKAKDYPRPSIYSEKERKIWTKKAEIGLNPSEIAKVLGVTASRATIQRALTDQGIEFQKNLRNDTVSERCYELRKTGLMWHQVAEQMTLETGRPFNWANTCANARGYAIRRGFLWPFKVSRKIKIPKKTLEIWIQRHQKGESIKLIAGSQYSKTFVRKRLVEAGIIPRKVKPRKLKNDPT